MGVLETLYGPLNAQEMAQLVADAQAAYDWPAILAEVQAIPAENRD